jgi:hypothetical protein
LDPDHADPGSRLCICDLLSTKARSNAIEAFTHRVKEVLPAEVYLLDTHPYEGEDENLHVAIIADVEGDRLNAAQPALAQATEEANVDLAFDPLVVYHVGQPHDQLAGGSREEGSRV